MKRLSLESNVLSDLMFVIGKSDELFKQKWEVTMDNAVTFQTEIFILCYVMFPIENGKLTAFLAHVHDTQNRMHCSLFMVVY